MQTNGEKITLIMSLQTQKNPKLNIEIQQKVRQKKSYIENPIKKERKN